MHGGLGVNRDRDRSPLFGVLLEAAGEGVYGLDCDGLTTFVNPSAVRMLGWNADELIGQPMHARLHHSHPDGSPFPPEECPIYAAFKDGQVHHVEDEVFWRKDGACFPVEYTSTPIREDGKLTGAVVVFWDITRRRRAEEALQQALVKVESLKRQLEEENIYLREEVREAASFGEIVGESAGLRRVVEQIDLVAGTDAGVLILGESGTGKELVAREIHRRSQRADRPLVKVNCASIPRDLYESEFFGHVKGAFTGAVRDRIGRFELANGGTLFLDEVGEIPIELQGKLLRVLQEGAYERVGDERTRSVDVRVVAATNRNLKEDLATGRFRQDLFYRLNVFPVDVPPLRDRPEDVAVLACHFVELAARKLSCDRPRLNQAALLRLQEYRWPGNVRELQNVIERAVITSRGGMLHLDLPATQIPEESLPSAATCITNERDVIPEAEMQRLERDNLLAALQRTKWRIYGPGGAAELLGIKPTTLLSRIRKMGLKKPN
jgi:PAS domain S-box-containing protein